MKLEQIIEIMDVNHAGPVQESRMNRSKTPPHLPTLPSDRDAYEQLYDLMPGGCDFDMIEDWKEKRIPSGLSAREVYFRLTERAPALPKSLALAVTRGLVAAGHSGRPM